MKEPKLIGRMGDSVCNRCQTTIDANTRVCDCPDLPHVPTVLKPEDQKAMIDSLPVNYLIWSKKRGGAWYRPDNSGYTDNPDIAGRYTAVEANRTNLGTHGDCVGYHESAKFVTKNRNEYLRRKRQLLRNCMETMTPQQVLDMMPELVNERIDLLVRSLI